MRFDIRPTVAAEVTNLVATSGIRSINLTWDASADGTTFTTQVYMNAAAPDFGSATLVAEVQGNTYTHVGMAVSTRYYWVRAKNSFGRADGTISNMATTSSQLAQELDIAAGAVTAAKTAIAAIDPASGNLAINSVTANSIQAGAITAVKIQAGSITANEISGAYVYAGTINAGQITAGSLSANFLSGGTISGSNINIGSGIFQVNGSTGYASMSNIGVSVASFGNLWNPTVPPITAQPHSSSTQPAIRAVAASGRAMDAVGDVYVNGTLTVTGSISGSVSYASSSGSASYAGTAGEVNNPGNAALRALSGTHAAIMQTDGNFVVYNSGVPVGSSSGGFPSDFRLKTGIQKTTISGASLISALRVVDFRWKPGTPMHDQVGDQVQTGFVAQEVRKLLPGAVSEISDTLLLNKTEIIPILVKHNQELELRVAAMQQDMVELRAMICNK